MNVYDLNLCSHVATSHTPFLALPFMRAEVARCEAGALAHLWMWAVWTFAAIPPMLWPALLILSLK